MIDYSGQLQPKVEAMQQANIEWEELTTLHDCLGQMQALREDLLKVRPLHRLIAGVNTPNVAYRAAMQNADQIHDNATELCGKLLTLHHAVEAVKQQMLLETRSLSGKQKAACEKFVQRLNKTNAGPDTEAQTLAAAALWLRMTCKPWTKSARKRPARTKKGAAKGALLFGSGQTLTRRLYALGRRSTPPAWRDRRCSPKLSASCGLLPRLPLCPRTIRTGRR